MAGGQGFARRVVGPSVPAKEAHLRGMRTLERGQNRIQCLRDSIDDKDTACDKNTLMPIEKKKTNERNMRVSAATNAFGGDAFDCLAAQFSPQLSD
jgi:hypothetical protein